MDLLLASGVVVLIILLLLGVRIERYRRIQGHALQRYVESVFAGIFGGGMIYILTYERPLSTQGILGKIVWAINLAILGAIIVMHRFEKSKKKR